MTRPDWQFFLSESFDYDLFANRAWLSPLALSGGEEERRVFNHILSASKIWLIRLDGISLPSMPQVQADEHSLIDLHDRWVDAVKRFDYGHLVEYHNLLGEEYVRSFGDIARHVLNHGTYHSGQIRGLFGVQGFDFPETDFMGFSFERDGVV